MTLLIIAIIVLVIFVAVSNKSKASSTNSQALTSSSVKIQKQDEIINNLYKRKSAITVTTSFSDPLKDDSIIDVTNQSQKINFNDQNSILSKYEAAVPYWSHTYIYSQKEIYSATAEQYRFYNLFKYRFLKGQYLDLDGNNNYAFILLFDLIKDYQVHKNLLLLEGQLYEIGKYYPKTKPYTISSLIKQLELNGDKEAISRVITTQNSSGSSYYYREPNPNYVFDGSYWRIGTKYKAKLQLRDDEVKLLNKLYYSGNNFCSIEYCFIEILRVYLSAIEEMKLFSIQAGTTMDDMVTSVADIILQKHHKYKSGSNNYKYGSESVLNEIYSNIFKRCENTVREKYEHKRKLNIDSYFFSTPEAKFAFEEKIVFPLAGILEKLVQIIKPPDEPTEIELFAQNTNRWKIKFDELTSNYLEKNNSSFIENILRLGKLNQKNPSVESVFFEASKFIAKYDKEASLRLYIYYLDYDLRSINFDNKQFTKTIQKNLFKNNEQLHQFQKIISEFVANKNIDRALCAVSTIYLPQRKKIKLDTKSILEVQQQHSGTVELLNEYLKDEYEDEANTIRSEEINKEELEIQVTSKMDIIEHSNYIDLPFSRVQTEILDMFPKNNFAVERIELINFAKSKAMFINQLVESINEICYDKLDDVLIEEEDDYYIINHSYYQRLLANDRQH